MKPLSNLSASIHQKILNRYLLTDKPYSAIFLFLIYY